MKRLLPVKVEEIAEGVVEQAQRKNYGVDLIHASAIWSDADQGEGVVVAIIDTGIDINHPDLKDRIIDGKSFVQGVESFQDDNGHGTHCAGIIASVAPKAKLLVLKALNGEGAGESAWINQAIDYAVRWRGPNGERVRVISMSLGGPADPVEYRLLKKAVSAGILVVCAAGNEGDGAAQTDELDYPAAYVEAVSVGACDQNAAIAEFSNSNKEVDVVAPGVKIYSTYPGGYAVLSGTSMATPHVSGAAALLIRKMEKEFGRKLTEAEIYAQLVKHTRTLAGVDRREQGNGLIDLAIDKA